MYTTDKRIDDHIDSSITPLSSFLGDIIRCISETQITYFLTKLLYGKIFNVPHLTNMTSSGAFDVNKV